MCKRKHIEDDGDIHVLINTDGKAVFVCSKCGRQWLGNFEPIEKASAEVRKNLVRVLSENQDLVRSMNIDMGRLSL